MNLYVWGSRLGATATTANLIIEVWEHGGVRRCEADDSITGMVGTHYATVPKADFETMAKAAIDLWNTSPAAWTECD